MAAALPIRRFALIDLLMMLLVLAGAGGLRAGYLLYCCDGGKSAGPLRVQDERLPVMDLPEGETMHGSAHPNEYDVLIHNVQSGNGFAVKAPFAEGSEATAHVAPGYPHLVGYLAQITPGEKLDFTVRWIQAGLGALTAVFYFLFARRAFRSLIVGTLAGLFAAAWPFWIISTATIDDGVLVTVTLAWCLFLCGQAGERGGALPSLVLGLSLGALPLVRAGMLPFAFVGLVWFLLRSRTLPSSWLCGLLAFLGFVTSLAPWTVRNYQTYNEPVTVVTSTYYHLWIGNNPEATGGPLTPEMMTDAPADELKEIPGQQARYARLGEVVKEEIKSRPLTTVRRRAHAAAAFFVGDKYLTDGTTADWTPPGEDQTVPSWLEGTYPPALQGALLGVLVLAFLGWRWSYGFHWESIPAALAMLWVPLPYIMGHAEGLSGPRLPLDGVLLCFAAFALVAMTPVVGGALLDPDAAAAKKAEED